MSKFVDKYEARHTPEYLAAEAKAMDQLEAALTALNEVEQGRWRVNIIDTANVETRRGEIQYS